MEEPFMLAVQHKGEEKEYEAQLQLMGYTHRFKVWVEGITIYYEQDEEGAYRAMLPPETDYNATALPDKDLLTAIAQKIEAILA